MSTRIRSSVSQERNYWLLGSLTLATLPAIGYALAFVYENRFCEVFGIPKDFVVINWTNLLIAMGSILGYSLVIFALIQTPYLIRMIGVSELGIISRRIFRHAIILLMVSFWYARYSGTEPYLFIAYIFPSPYLLADFVFPLISQRKVPGYRNKLEAQDKEDSKKQIDFPVFIKKHSRIILLVIFAILVLYLTANFEGKKSAIEKEDFMVPSAYPQSVVLKVYNDTIICAPLDRADNTIDRSFFFIKLGDNTDLTFTIQKIGPLRTKR